MAERRMPSSSILFLSWWLLVTLTTASVCDPATGLIYVNGNKLSNCKDGSPFLGRGVNILDWYNCNPLAQLADASLCSGAAADNAVNEVERQIAVAKTWGFNSFRLVLEGPAGSKSSSVFDDPNFIQNLAKVVASAYPSPIMVSLWRSNEQSWDDDFVESPDLGTGTPTAATPAAWYKIASQLIAQAGVGKTPHVIFGIANEPCPYPGTPTYQTCVTESWKWMNQSVAMIRQAEAEAKEPTIHVVSVQGLGMYGRDLSPYMPAAAAQGTGPIKGSTYDEISYGVQVVYETHPYNHATDPYPLDNTKTAWEGYVFDPANTTLPVIVGEFGIANQSVMSESDAEAFFALVEAAGIPFFVWAFGGGPNNCNGFIVDDYDTDALTCGTGWPPDPTTASINYVPSAPWGTFLVGALSKCGAAACAPGSWCCGHLASGSCRAISSALACDTYPGPKGPPVVASGTPPTTTPKCTLTSVQAKFCTATPRLSNKDDTSYATLTVQFGGTDGATVGIPRGNWAEGSVHTVAGSVVAPAPSYPCAQLPLVDVAINMLFFAPVGAGDQWDFNLAVTLGFSNGQSSVICVPNAGIGAGGGSPSPQKCWLTGSPCACNDSCKKHCSNFPPYNGNRCPTYPLPKAAGGASTCAC